MPSKIEADPDSHIKLIPRTTPVRKLYAWWFALYLLIALAVHFVALGRAGIGETEADIAVGARTMLESGRWTTAAIDGEPDNAEPPLAYWAVAAGYELTGREDEFVTRLPTALAALLLGFAAFRTLGTYISPRCGFLTAAAVSTSWVMLEQSRLAGFDGLTALGVGVALLAAGRNLVLRRHEVRYWIIAYVGLLAGLLASGLPAVAVVVPGLFAAAAMLRSARALLHPAHLIGVGVFLLGATGYFVWEGNDDGRSVFTCSWQQAGMEAAYGAAGYTSLTLAKPIVAFAFLLPWSGALLLAFARRSIRPGRSVGLLLRIGWTVLITGTLALVCLSPHPTQHLALLVTPCAVIAAMYLELLLRRATHAGTETPCPSLVRLEPSPVECSVVSSQRAGTTHEGTQPHASRTSATGGRRYTRARISLLPACLLVAALIVAAVRVGVIEPRRGEQRGLRQIAEDFQPLIAPDQPVCFDAGDSYALMAYYLDRPARRWRVTERLPVSPCFAVLLDERLAELPGRLDVACRRLLAAADREGQRYHLAILTNTVGDDSGLLADMIPNARDVSLPVEGETIAPPPTRCDQSAPRPAQTIVVSTFNIHGGRGRDGRLDPTRTASVISGADFIGLQEVTRGREPDARLDLVEVLARLLRLNGRGFFRVNQISFWDGGGEFGNAFATVLPVTAQEGFELPAVAGVGKRGMAWARSGAYGHTIDFFVIHLALLPPGNTEAQFTQLNAALAVIDRISPDPDGLRVLMGDFNASPDSPLIASLSERFEEVLMTNADQPPPARVDYIFHSKSIEAVTACLVPSEASDHPAVFAVLKLLDVR